MPRIDLDSPCVPVGWQAVLFNRLGRGVRRHGRVRTWAGSGYASLGGPVGGHSIYLVEIRPIAKLIRKLVAPGLSFIIPGI